MLALSLPPPPQGFNYTDSELEVLVQNVFAKGYRPPPMIAHVWKIMQQYANMEITCHEELYAALSRNHSIHPGEDPPETWQETISPGRRALRTRGVCGREQPLDNEKSDPERKRTVSSRGCPGDTTWRASARGAEEANSEREREWRRRQARVKRDETKPRCIHVIRGRASRRRRSRRQPTSTATVHCCMLHAIGIRPPPFSHSTALLRALPLPVGPSSASSSACRSVV
jgi:hypothetical protein